MESGGEWVTVHARFCGIVGSCEYWSFTFPPKRERNARDSWNLPLLSPLRGRTKLSLFLVFKKKIRWKIYIYREREICKSSWKKEEEEKKSVRSLLLSISRQPEVINASQCEQSTRFFLRRIVTFLLEMSERYIFTLWKRKRTSVMQWSSKIKFRASRSSLYSTRYMVPLHCFERK